MSTNDVENFVDELYNYAKLIPLENEFIQSTEAQSSITITKLIKRIN